MKTILGYSINEIASKNTTSEKGLIQSFKKGDVIACYAGYPCKELCVVELITDDLNIENVIDGISGKSLIPTTSHIISAQWYKIN